MHRGKIKSWLSKIFELNPAGLNWPRGVLILDVILVPLVVLAAIGYEQYLLSAVFGALFSGLADPGGNLRHRTWSIAVFSAAGAGLTAAAFALGGQAWGWLVLVSFAVTLAAGLGVMFGVHRFAAAVLLNFWFVIALGVAFSLHGHPHKSNYTWAEVLAWVGGSALWIVVLFIDWLMHGRQIRPQPFTEIPGDTSRRKLTPPLIMFAVIRALALAGAVAIAFGANLSHGLWLPIATLVALKPSLEQTTLYAVQRLAGAALGAGTAALMLLIPANVHGLKVLGVKDALEVVALVLLMHGAATRFLNYAIYQAAIAAGVLILIDLPQPSNDTAVGYRVLWTLCGVAIGVVVMLLGGLIAKRGSKHHTSQPTQPAHAR
jgi:uncharacterized membrane protein YccC